MADPPLAQRSTLNAHDPIAWIDIMMRVEKDAEVRTTVSIEDRLLKQAKRRALVDGVSLGEIVNRALRQALLPPVTRNPGLVFRLLTFQGDPSLFSDVSPAEVAQRRDADTVR